MRIGIRLAITSLVLASIIVSAIGVHLLWWRTAEGNSQALAATINEQIVSAVGKELETITTQVRAAHTAIRTLSRGRQAGVCLSLSAAGATGHILGGVRLARRCLFRRP